MPPLPIPTLALCLALPALALAAQSQPQTRAGDNPRVAVLDLVDLADNQPKTEITEVLRRSLAATGRWSVLRRDSTAKRMADYGQNPQTPCNNPQCGFDAGNILNSDYVLFGTTANLQSVDAITLKLLRVKGARIVWTAVTENPHYGGDPMRGLEKVFAAAAADMDTSRFHANKEKGGARQMAVVDLSENSFGSRVFFERVCTRIYGSADYDLMSPSELSELLNALEINKYSVVPTAENMIALGEKLGVSNLVYSRLSQEGRNYQYRLAVYDIANKALVLELPPQPSGDFAKLLDYERAFFRTLFERGAAPRRKDAKVGGSHLALWLGLGALGLGGGLAAYWLETQNHGAGGAAPSDCEFGSPPCPPGDVCKDICATK